MNNRPKTAKDSVRYAHTVFRGEKNLYRQKNRPSERQGAARARSTKCHASSDRKEADRAEGDSGEQLSASEHGWRGVRAFTGDARAPPRRGEYRRKGKHREKLAPPSKNRVKKKTNKDLGGRKGLGPPSMTKELRLNFPPKVTEENGNILPEPLLNREEESARHREKKPIK